MYKVASIIPYYPFNIFEAYSDIPFSFPVVDNFMSLTVLLEIYLLTF